MNIDMLTQYADYYNSLLHGRDSILTNAHNSNQNKLGLQHHLTSTVFSSSLLWYPQVQ